MQGESVSKKIKRIGDQLQLRKLELEALELESQYLLRAEKAKRELEKLDQEIVEKKQLNGAREKLDGLTVQKAFLEIEEKKLSTKYAARTGVWDVLKYTITLTSVLTAVIIGYTNYLKDNRTFQHQVRLEQKFKIDAQVLDLIKNLGDGNPVVVSHAALALPAYGRPAMRLLIPHLKHEHPKDLYKVFIESLVEIVVLQPDEAQRNEVALEFVQRMTNQLGSVVDEFIAAQSPVRKAFVTAHLEGLIQIQDRCSALACAPLRAALKQHSNEVRTSIQKLESAGGSFDQSLLASVKKILV